MDSLIENIQRFVEERGIVVDYLIKIGVVILIFIAMKIVNGIASVVIDKFFASQKKSRFRFSDKKADTLSGIIKSVTRYVLYIFGTLMILEQIGIKTQTLLVGAGLGGIIVGFGAQNLVKDILSGFFILFEDQFSVGEYITIDNMSGIVETIGLRVTRIKDFSGDLHIIPNGQINTVTNHSRDNARAVVDVEVGYDTNIDRVINVLKEVGNDFKKENPDIAEGPDVLGITKLGDYGITIRMLARTKPMSHWDVERELMKKVKEAFDRENINIPYPTSVIIAKSGNN